MAALLAWSPAFGKSIEDRKWILMESENFVVHSAIGKRSTERLVKYLEAVHSLFIDSAAKKERSKVPTGIFVISKRQDLVELGFENADNMAGFFVPRMRRNIMFILEYSNVDETAIAVHEYVHYLQYNLIRFPFPKWYQEGYAEWVAGSSMGKKHFDIGLPYERRLAWLAESRRWLPWETIIDSSAFAELEDSQDIGRFYSQAWLLTHFLLSRPNGEERLKQSFLRYGNALQDGASEIEAFERGFGYTLQELDDELEDYSRKRVYNYSRVPLQELLSGFDTSTRRLSREEISVELAELILTLRFPNIDTDSELFSTTRRLFANGLDDPATRARAEIGTAYMLEMAGDYDAAEKYVASGASLAQQDFHVQLDAAQFFINRSMRSDQVDESQVARAEPFLQTALAMDSSDAEIIFTSGLFSLASGSVDRALEHILAATIAAPAVPEPRLLLIGLLLESEQTDLAHEYASDMLLFMHHDPEAAQQLRALVEEIERSHQSTETGSKEP